MPEGLSEFRLQPGFDSLKILRAFCHQSVKGTSKPRLDLVLMRDQTQLVCERDQYRRKNQDENDLSHLCSSETGFLRKETPKPGRSRTIFQNPRSSGNGQKLMLLKRTQAKAVAYLGL
jgi:hypothetical protein